MEKTQGPKDVFISAIYVVVILLFIIIIDYSLALLLNGVIFKLIYWFDNLNLARKIIFLILIGGGILGICFAIFSVVGSVISRYIFRIFPHNHFTRWAFILLFAVNILLSIKVVWDSFIYFDFWGIIEFLVVIFGVLGINYIIISSHSTKEAND